jgi:hypothetical protein
MQPSQVPSEPNKPTIDRNVSSSATSKSKADEYHGNMGQKRSSLERQKVAE